MAVADNLKHLEVMLGPRRPGSPRVYHNVIGRTVDELFPSSSDPLPIDPVDNSIGVWDGALSNAECDEIIALFEASPEMMFEGNLLSYGKVVVDHNYKKASRSATTVMGLPPGMLCYLVHPACFQVTELDISDKAQTNAAWLAWDRRFFALTLRHIQLYEELNPIVKTFVNPSEDSDAPRRPGTQLLCQTASSEVRARNHTVRSAPAPIRSGRGRL